MGEWQDQVVWRHNCKRMARAGFLRSARWLSHYVLDAWLGEIQRRRSRRRHIARRLMRLNLEVSRDGLLCWRREAGTRRRLRRLAGVADVRGSRLHLFSAFIGWWSETRERARLTRTRYRLEQHHSRSTRQMALDCWWQYTGMLTRLVRARVLLERWAARRMLACSMDLWITVIASAHEHARERERVGRVAARAMVHAAAREKERRQRTCQRQCTGDLLLRFHHVVTLRRVMGEWRWQVSRELRGAAVVERAKSRQRLQDQRLVMIAWWQLCMVSASERVACGLQHLLHRQHACAGSQMLSQRQRKCRAASMGAWQMEVASGVCVLKHVCNDIRVTHVCDLFTHVCKKQVANMRHAYHKHASHVCGICMRSRVCQDGGRVFATSMLRT